MKRWLAAIIVIGAAVVAGIVIYSQRAKNEIESQLYIPKQAKITPEIRLLQDYVRIDTSNPPGRELAGARFLANLLKQNGVAAEIIESAPGRGNVYARLKGRRSGQGLLLMNHIDVVPADPKEWKRPPFRADIYLNQLWGRGALDMKSIGLCELDAFLAVARTRRPPERDLVFLAVSDEEAGGKLGTQWLLEHRPDIFEDVRYAVNEGGVTETKQEQLTYFGIEIGTKIAVRLRLRAASREKMQRVRLALEPFMSPRDADRILPEVREFLHDIASQRVEIHDILNDVVETQRVGKLWLLPRGYKELLQNVMWMSGVHTAPNGATMDVNLYDLPDEPPARRIAWLRAEVEPLGATIDDVISQDAPTPFSSTRTPLYGLIVREVKKQYGDVAAGTEILAASSNDSRYLRQRGINAYGLWPFEVDYFQALGIHGPDERVRVDWYMDGIALMRRLVAAYAFEPLPQ